MDWRRSAIGIGIALQIIGLLAYGIDRLLYWFQLGLFPHRSDDE